MKRTKMNELIRWKSTPGRKPLLIRGARQVGKTWLMKEFGKANYEQTAYVNFEQKKHLKSLFKDDFNVHRILIALQAETGLTLHADNTLIVFDEIQEVPEAITALKYFMEDSPEYHIVAAGSLLGVALHANFSFPVGKVSFMDLQPLSFIEFLDALGEKGLLTILQSNDWKLITAFKTKLIDRLRQYYYVGGMPEAVAKFCENNNFQEVRKIHKQILNAYELDFSKHVPAAVVPRIRMLWNSIPAQLAKENRKFIYGLVKKGSRAKDYELALSWMVDCGQVKKINRITKPAIPLKAYEDRNAFKLFLLDIGLLAAMGEIEAGILLKGNAIFTEFKGALTEQYVLQQLVNSGDLEVCYWSAAHSSAEVDFIVQYKNRVIPLEVKSEENLHAKSLKVYHEKFSPKISLRSSMSDFRAQEWLINIPLYAISQLTQLIH